MGADLLVRGSVALAHRAHVSPALVAATIVALGTSVPELVVAVRATLTNHPEMVLGNVVGSNIANVLLVGGGAAVISALPVDRRALRRDSLSMMGVSLVFVLMCVTTGLNRLAGLILLTGLVMVWGLAARVAVRDYQSRDNTTPLERVLGLPSHLLMIALFVALGAIGLPVGARLVVDAAVDIAVHLGVTETVVGLTIIAFSTSLPELATTVIAAYQKRAGVAIGTIVGSNVLNLVGIMGVAGVISASPIEVSPGVRNLDLPMMIGSSLMLSVFVWLRRPIGRASGVIWLVAYCAYIAMLFVVR